MKIVRWFFIMELIKFKLVTDSKWYLDEGVDQGYLFEGAEQGEGKLELGVEKTI